MIVKRAIKKVSTHLPSLVLVPLSLHFGQDVVQGSDLGGNGVDLHPDTIGVHPGHPRAGQPLHAWSKLADVVVGPDGAW